MGADFRAHFASHAVLLGHMGLACVVLLHLACPAAASHADVLHRAAKACRFMALKVGQGDKHIRIHHRPADFGFLHIFAAFHRHQHLVVALDSVGNNHMAPGGHGVKPVQTCGVQMIQPVFPPAHIQGVAVGQKGLSTPLLHKVGHGLCPVGPQEGQIARLPEMHFDGHIFFVKVNVAHPGSLHQPRQLLLQIFVIIRPQICPINLRCHK